MKTLCLTGWVLATPLKVNAFEGTLQTFRRAFTSTHWLSATSSRNSTSFAPNSNPVCALSTASHSASKGRFVKRKPRPTGVSKTGRKSLCKHSVHKDPWRGSAFSHAYELRKHDSSKKTTMATTLKVAVVGCAHGELESLYNAIGETEQAGGIQIDVVICAGDFQAVRNEFDLQSLACPVKYRDMRSFWKYYAGHLVAPVPTIFIGGNHEASNHLQEIPLGGLVAPNIYFLGYAGVINFRGLRIAGVSGTYVEHAYRRKRTERPPYAGSSVRSVYHLREEDVGRLLRLSRRNDADAKQDGAIKAVDIMLSHDWPKGITDYGNVEQLLRVKPFLASEIAQGVFGNAPVTQVLHTLQPKYWFSAHMHVKFAAVVKHPPSNDASDDTNEAVMEKRRGERLTRFLALDKILPRRDFLQILDIPVDAGDGAGESNELHDGECQLSHDLEWLTVLRTEAEDGSRTSAVTKEEMDATREILKSHGISMTVRMKSDFERVAKVYSLSSQRPQSPKHEQPAFRLQQHNVRLFAALGVSAPPDYVLLTCPGAKVGATIPEETETQSAAAMTEEGCNTDPAAIP